MKDLAGDREVEEVGALVHRLSEEGEDNLIARQKGADGSAEHGLARDRAILFRRAVPGAGAAASGDNQRGNLHFHAFRMYNAPATLVRLARFRAQE